VISRVQQSMIAFEIAPAVLGAPDRGHVHVPELVGALDSEEPRPAPPTQGPVALQQPMLAHQALGLLAVHRSS